MTVHDVGATHFAEHVEAEWIGSLTANEPGIANRAHAQRSNGVLVSFFAERDERRWHAIGHLPRQLEGISLGSAHHTVRSEWRWHDVNDVHRATAPAGLAR